METTNTPAPELNVNDLISIQQLIDVACRRGAFQANEMKTVGELYEKLVAFTEGVVAAQQTADTESNTVDENEQGDTNA
jgi:hypothetical protein